MKANRRLAWRVQPAYCLHQARGRQAPTEAQKATLEQSATLEQRTLKTPREQALPSAAALPERWPHRPKEVAPPRRLAQRVARGRQPCREAIALLPTHPDLQGSA